MTYSEPGRIHETPYGILHLDFSPTESTLFATATSIGQVTFFHIFFHEKIDIVAARTLSICDQSTLILHLDWRHGLDEPSQLALALSDGRVAKVTLDSGSNWVRFVQAHSLETWYVAWPNLSPIRIFSGGDDSCLCMTYAACEEDDYLADDGPENPQGTAVCKPMDGPHAVDKRIHSAGVTAILPLGHQEGRSVILTGSYDEHLRILRLKANNTKWDVVFEIALGGGVWRVNPLHEELQEQVAIEKGWKSTLIVSCAHAGPKILQLSYAGEDEWSARIIAQLLEHQSMNYASKATTLESYNRSSLKSVVSTSFYDGKICLWHIKGC